MPARACRCRDCRRHPPTTRLYEPAPDAAPRCYRTIRFYRNGRPRTIRNNLTEAEAQQHCSDPKTRGDGWFDGYDYMRGCRPRTP
jgi:hypothetical protein